MKANQNQDTPPCNATYAASNSSCNINTANKPIYSVINSWLTLETIVSKTPFSRYSGARYNILPPYSPMRLGVLSDKEIPDNTDFTACRNEKEYSRFTSKCHLQVSNVQLMGMSSNATHNFHAPGALKAPSICCSAGIKLGCAAIC